jgi:hypothetical protein
LALAERAALSDQTVLAAETRRLPVRWLLLLLRLAQRAAETLAVWLARRRTADRAGLAPVFRQVVPLSVALVAQRVTALVERR